VKSVRAIFFDLGDTLSTNGERIADVLQMDMIG